ncbi:MAG: hypothetical protein R6W94_13755, partial [Spirochaetia bacterium]
IIGVQEQPARQRQGIDLAAALSWRELRPGGPKHEGVGTKLTPAQRRSQINALALTGGLLLYSDDFERLAAETLAEITTIQQIAGECFNGRLLPWDMMEHELPAILLNTAGYLGVFNMGPKRGRTVHVPLSAMHAEAETVNIIWNAEAPGDWSVLEEVWSGERVRPERGQLVVGPLGPFESKLFWFVRG